MRPITQDFYGDEDLDAGETDRATAALYADDDRDFDLGRRGPAAPGKARPRKDRHGRLINPKSAKAAQRPAAHRLEAPVPDVAQATGIVCKKLLGRYVVNTDAGAVECSISSSLRKQLIYPIADPTSLRHHVMKVQEIKQVDPVAVGDRVRFVEAGDGEGMIVEVLPRTNKLARRAAGVKPLEQVIVANVDQVVAILAAAHPTPKWEVLDRYLAAAEQLGLPAVICLTKLDLGAEQFLPEIENYRGLGYPVLLTSIVSGEGIPEFAATLHDRISVLVGPSGVGKTSLLNTIQPGLGRRVGEVSKATNKGKHTTTHLELFTLDAGGGLIDTPGMREFGLWDVDDADLARTFLEMRPLIGQCQFGLTCRHRREPGCAVKQAVITGAMSERRYQSFLALRGD